MARLTTVPLALLIATAAGCGGAGTEPAPDRHRVPFPAALSNAGDAVTSAFEAVGRTRTRAELEDELRGAGALVDDALVDLERARPPRGATAAHAHAVSGLSALSDAIASAEHAVRTGRICTPAAALATLSRTSGARRLRAAGAALRAQGFPAGQLAPRARRVPNRRFSNGTVLRPLDGGAGRLVVTNGSDFDGVVKLVDGRRRLSLYVGRHRTAIADGIPDGTFQLYFASGRAWEARRNTFSRACSFSRFDAPLRFRSGADTYTRFEVSLNPVEGGNASTSVLDPTSFPE